MSDTPRTDAAMLRADDIESGGTFDAVDAQVSRQLERELDEALEWKHYLSSWGGTPEIVYSFIIGQQARIYAAQEVEKHLTAVTKQRDELADALRNCREDSVELLSERSWWQNERRCDYQTRYTETAENIIKANSALAALKGGGA